MTIRTGLFRFVRWRDVPAFEARGWWVITNAVDCHHAGWSALMWHCECGEMQP